MRKHRSKSELVRVIVARKTKGLAFTVPGDKYEARLAHVRRDIEANMEVLSPSEFRERYKDYLWDER